MLGYAFKQSNVDVLLMRMDVSGQLLWMKTIGSSKKEESGQTVIENSDSQIVFTGRTFISDHSDGDLFIMIDSTSFKR